MHTSGCELVCWPCSVYDTILLPLVLRYVLASLALSANQVGDDYNTSFGGYGG